MKVKSGSKGRVMEKRDRERGWKEITEEKQQRTGERGRREERGRKK